MKNNLKIYKSKTSRLIVLFIISIILFFIGEVMARKGFKDWYIKVQKPSDEKLRLEIEKLKETKN